MEKPAVKLDTPENIAEVYDYYTSRQVDHARTEDVYAAMNVVWDPQTTWEKEAKEMTAEHIASGGLVMVIKPHDSNHNPFQDAAGGFADETLLELVRQGVHILAKQDWYKYRLVRNLFDDAGAIPTSRHKDPMLRELAANAAISTCATRMIEFGEHSWSYPAGHRNKSEPKLVPDVIRKGTLEIIRRVERSDRSFLILPAASWSGESRLQRWTWGALNPTMSIGRPFTPDSTPNLEEKMIRAMQRQLNLARKTFIVS